MNDHSNTNWNWSVTGIAIRDNTVLLARHTYGGGKGKWIVPGGYLENGESPADAVKREFLEETGVTVAVEDVIGLRCSEKNWYLAFRVSYVSGEARSDGDENDAVAWMDIAEAMQRDDVPGLTKALIGCALAGTGLAEVPFETQHGGVLYGVSRPE